MTEHLALFGLIRISHDLPQRKHRLGNIVGIITARCFGNGIRRPKLDDLLHSFYFVLIPICSYPIVLKMSTRKLQRATHHIVALLLWTSFLQAYTASAYDKYLVRLDDDIYATHRLVSHVLETRTVSNAFTCYKVCLDNCFCLSFNYCAKERKCELNSVRKRDDPDNYKADDACTYHEITWSDRESQCNVSMTLVRDDWELSCLKVSMTRNGVLKNHKVHCVRIIVWRFIFERNDVKCLIEVFEKAAVRRKNGPCLATNLSALEVKMTTHWFYPEPISINRREITSHEWRKCSRHGPFFHPTGFLKWFNIELNIISFKNKSPYNNLHIMNFMILPGADFLAACGQVGVAPA